MEALIAFLIIGLIINDATRMLLDHENLRLREKILSEKDFRKSIMLMTKHVKILKSIDMNKIKKYIILVFLILSILIYVTKNLSL